MIEKLTALMEVKRGGLQKPFFAAHLGQLEPLHGERKPLVEIFLRHRQRLLGRLGLRLVQFLVVIFVERDPVARDVHEEIAAVSQPIVHFLQRVRSEEHTSELQSLMRISYAVFCLKKKKKYTHNS